MSIASEGGHWYTCAGEPAYTVIGANGKERPTTLRDARKQHLVPSVTTVLNLISKPGLVYWQIDQALTAALTLPQIEGESLDDFKVRAKADSEAQAKEAAEEGTRIHTAIELAMQGKAYDQHYKEHVEGVKAALVLFGDQEWLAEKSFCHVKGYGGKVDLHSQDVVIDFKTKDFGPDDKLPRAFPEQIMQLAAYRVGLGLDAHTELANVYVSRSHPGLVHVVRHKPADALHAEKSFFAILNTWQILKDYTPEVM